MSSLQSFMENVFRHSVQFFAGEVEKRCGEHQEHEDAEKVAGGKWPEDFGAKGKQVGAPGQMQHRYQPVRNIVGNFRILKKIDDDSQQAEYSTSRDQAA